MRKLCKTLLHSDCSNDPGPAYYPSALIDGRLRDGTAWHVCDLESLMLTLGQLLHASERRAVEF